jgi:hypothetical protein
MSGRSASSSPLSFSVRTISKTSHRSVSSSRRPTRRSRPSSRTRPSCSILPLRRRSLARSTDQGLDWEVRSVEPSLFGRPIPSSSTSSPRSRPMGANRGCLLPQRLPEPTRHLAPRPAAILLSAFINLRSNITSSTTRFSMTAKFISTIAQLPLSLPPLPPRIRPLNPLLPPRSLLLLKTIILQTLPYSLAVPPCTRRSPPILANRPTPRLRLNPQRSILSLNPLLRPAPCIDATPLLIVQVRSFKIFLLPPPPVLSITKMRDSMTFRRP